MQDVPFSRRAFLAGTAAAAALPGGRALAGAEPGAAVTSPILVEDGRLWLAASIRGGPPLLFVIDTGAGFAYIRPDIAKALKLQAAGGQLLGGLGKNKVIGTLYIARDVVFGGSIGESVVAFASYDFGRGLPPEAAGLLASGLFTTRDSDLDFDADQWRLWPRGGHPPRDGYEALASSIGARGDATRFTPRLTVTATLDGVAYKCLLDTGSPTGLLFLPGGTRRSGLFSDGRPFSPRRTNGFGGAAAKMSRQVRAGRFALGPLTVDRPLVTLMDPDQTSSITDHDALIGLPFIRLLNLSTDVLHNRLWAARSRQPVPTESYGRAGLWLEPGAEGRAIVTIVGTGSPAALAGVEAGDRIEDPPSFAAALRRVRTGNPPSISLDLTRGGVRRTVTLRMADWL
ncbi:aspartyl protease family protein [Sphingomonas morindae]|uniref:Aspartyl protease family protein n=1 Tax=Sphingomonas morindae TaxID=1541170 RepID=A0ABY4X3I3_9SPHN|nr:aspartyl protease family protein [Sphingomonas morindae]USI71452.1 aspartyl protease family protein [Sphingomonas morindae]